MASAETSPEGLPPTGTDVWLEALVPVGVSSVIMTWHDEFVCLDQPQVAGHLVPVHLGQSFRMTYRHRDVPNRAPLRAAQGPPQASTDGLWAELTGPPVRDQKRESFRLAVTAPVVLIEIDEEENDGKPPDEKSACLLDLSTGGARVGLAAAPRPGTRVQLDIDLPDEIGDILVARGSVVRWIPSTSDAALPSVGVMFDELEDEERVRRYLLERQRVQRRRALGLQ